MQDKEAHIYKGRFTPSEAIRDVYTDENTANGMFEEMSIGLSHVKTELQHVGGRTYLSRDKRMVRIIGISNQGNKKTRFSMGSFVAIERQDNGLYVCEFEMGMYSDSTDMIKWMRETMEDGLPPSISISRDLKYVKIGETPDKTPVVQFAEFMTA